ncbi:iron chelate uptake ABC transporter family permease subunit [Candidatus Acetothermia bacterium]|nr:iron chelate uptake ABC transporter family permease subunit [Candidatus Acetothermia bacterium]
MRKKKRWVLFSLCCSLLVGIPCAVAIGPVFIPVTETAKILLNHFPFVVFSVSDLTNALIVDQVRLPRVLLAALVGFALAACGTVMQGLFRNPLADPYLLGIASGATAGAATVIALRLDALPFVLPLGAFLGGLLVVLIVYQLSRTPLGRLDNLTLILAGVALAALFSAISSFLLFVANNDQTRRIVFWVLGGLGGAQWTHVQLLVWVIVLGMSVLLLFARDLNALVLGEEMATHLGVDSRHLKKLLLGTATLMTAAAVATAGTIGFIGLIVPHALRWLVGPDHRMLLPVAGLSGALLLLACDTAARTVLQPAELPVGIITALLGAPFFLFLLRRQKQAFVRPLSREGL